MHIVWERKGGGVDGPRVPVNGWGAGFKWGGCGSANLKKIEKMLVACSSS